MKAAIYTEYGAPSVLRLTDLEKPLPKDGELCIRVVASNVSAGVIWMRQGKYPHSKLFTVALRLMFGMTKPKNPVLGVEFSGIVEEVGKNVKNFRKGDRVCGTTTGLKQGAFAEYVCVPETSKQGVIVQMPQELTFVEAAALPVGAMTALCLLRKAHIRKEHSVLVYGASGSVGTSAVQLAAYLGGRIVGVCSGKNVALVRSLGANEVIDYTITDLHTCTKRFDIVFDAVGKLAPTTAKQLLKQGGKHVSVLSMTDEKTEYLTFVKDMIRQGAFKPVIDKIYPLTDIVQASEYVETGHKCGNVVVAVTNLEEQVSQKE
jgi:NADPH:quinone reductase-like Zn-dependent oxidoreductase